MINTNFLKYQLAIAILRERVQRLSTGDRMDFDELWEVIMDNPDEEARRALITMSGLFAKK